MRVFKVAAKVCVDKGVVGFVAADLRQFFDQVAKHDTQIQIFVENVRRARVVEPVARQAVDIDDPVQVDGVVAQQFVVGKNGAKVKVEYFDQFARGELVLLAVDNKAHFGRFGQFIHKQIVRVQVAVRDLQLFKHVQGVEQLEQDRLAVRLGQGVKDVAEFFAARVGDDDARLAPPFGFRHLGFRGGAERGVEIGAKFGQGTGKHFAQHIGRDVALGQLK